MNRAKSSLIAVTGTMLILGGTQAAEAHFVPWPHEHGTGYVFAPYTEFEYQGTVDAACNAGSVDSTLSYTELYMVGNKFITQTGLDSGFASATVGFDVDSVFSQTMSYSQTVPAGKCVYLDLEYVYALTAFEAWVHYYGFGMYDELATAAEYQYPFFIPYEKTL
jgi:hypothetical protein